MTKNLFRRVPPFSRWPDWTILLAFFLYALIVGLLIQLVLLPYIFPAWNAGDGLLVGLDSGSFNHIAILQAQKIAAEGWQAWRLAPDGQPVSGIASVFYALIAPHPWTVLPLNALLHALAAWALYKILRFLLEKRRHALLASLPFLLFPSALSWVSQMHNDNYAVTGGILLLYGWVCFARQESWKNVRTIIGGILAILAGGILAWLVRDYVVDMYMAVGGVILIFEVVLFLARWIRKRWTWMQAITACAVACLAFGLVVSLQMVNVNQRGITVKTGLWKQGSVGPAVSTGSPGTGNSVRGKWEETRWLPSWIDHQMEQLSIKRARAIKAWTSARKIGKGSNIDTDVYFRNAMDIIRYLPRAAEIGLLSPFPADWFDRGSKAPNTMMRRVSGVEMVIVYLCWPGLLYACWVWRKRPEFWAGVLFCFGMLAIYALGTPNVGALYRLRYPYIMPLVGLGLAGWMTFILQLSRRVKESRKPAAGVSNG